MLRRTNYGLTNLHCFLKVDAVVIVEGGEETYSIEQIAQGQFSERAIDILFWENAFSFFINNIRVSVRACGSKDIILDIASEIALGNIKNLFVAMDRDHDHINGKIINSPGVLYTLGYSWENDVFKKSILFDTFHSISMIAIDAKDFMSEIENNLSDFYSQIRWAVYADILLSLHKHSLLPRKNPESVIFVSRKGYPSLNRERILFLFAQVPRRGSYLVPEGMTFCPENDCIGHVISSYCYRLILYLCKKYSTVSKFPKSIFYSVAIDKFFNKLSTGNFPHLYSHYKKQFDLLRSI